MLIPALSVALSGIGGSDHIWGSKTSTHHTQRLALPHSTADSCLYDWYDGVFKAVSAYIMMANS